MQDQHRICTIIAPVALFTILITFSTFDMDINDYELGWTGYSWCIRARSRIYFARALSLLFSILAVCFWISKEDSMGFGTLTVLWGGLDRPGLSSGWLGGWVLQFWAPGLEAWIG